MRWMVAIVALGLAGCQVPDVDQARRNCGWTKDRSLWESCMSREMDRLAQRRERDRDAAMMLLGSGALRQPEPYYHQPYMMPVQPAARPFNVNCYRYGNATNCSGY